MKISKEKIEYIMATKGFTASMVEDKSGISRQNFSTIKLRGTCSPVTAGKIAHGLEANLTEIIEKGE